MKSLIGYIVISMLASTAFAGMDPATDSFGIYFDPGGYTNCYGADVGQLFPVYLILSNPAGPTSGFECSITITGVPYVAFMTLSAFDCAIAPGEVRIDGNYVCTGPSSLPVPVNGALVLMAWSAAVLGQAPLLFDIGPSVDPSLPGGMPVVVGDGVLRRGAVASAGITYPVAGVNPAGCPVSEEVNSFGAIKSLYR